MKFLSALLLTALLGYTVGVFSILPWYCFAFTSFIVAIAIPQRAWKAFLSGFIALFILWALLAILIDQANQHLLSTKIANMLPLGGSYILLIIMTAFTGALVSGFAALAGSFIRKRS